MRIRIIRLVLLVLAPGGLLLWGIAGCTATGAWDGISNALEPAEIDDDPPEEEPPLWARRVEVTIDGTQTNEMLFGFPVMVRLPAGTIEEDLVNDGADNFGFFDREWTEDLQPLEHTMASGGPEEDYVFWIKLATILPGSETTTIYLYYGGTERVTPAGAAVWDNGYTVVMHFEEGSAEEGYIDSSPFGNHSVPSAGHTEPVTAEGFAGRAVDFVDATDALIIPNSPSIETMQPFTFSAYVNYRDFRSSSRLFSKGSMFLQYKDIGTHIQYKYGLSFDTTDATLDRNDDRVLNDWRFISVVWNGTTAAGSASLRGDLSGMNTVTSAWGSGARDSDSAYPLALGNGEWNNANRAVDGLVDEVRVSRVARSLTWLVTEYRSYTGDLVTIGAVENLEESP